jgi:hypothetical protein
MFHQGEPGSENDGRGNYERTDTKRSWRREMLSGTNLAFASLSLGSFVSDISSDIVPFLIHESSL